MKRFLVVAVLLIAVILAVPTLRYPALALIGMGNGCTVAKAAAIRSEKKELEASKDRILARQKLVRKDARLELWDTPYGQFWTPEGSEFILPFNLAEQETKIYGTGERAVHPGDIVLDCGANVGVYTREALRDGAKIVVAIEPAPDNLECLRRNFTKEIESGQVILYPKGVWDKDDFLEFRVDPKNQAADSFVIKREGAEVVSRLPLTTIDKLVDELKLPSVDYIKMDIEGAEVKALLGARNTLARFHPRMALSTYHQDDHPVEVPKAARAAFPGYKTECGPCNAEGFRVRPDVVYFYK
ncbi:MAG: FkbM family methyltransferase [Bryobacterales bacterium]|nr:FkbM family methyltransferase [Bryobacterales bacterium]